VGDFEEVSFEKTVVSVGQTTSLPFTVEASASNVTNLQIRIELRANPPIGGSVLTDPVLIDVQPELACSKVVTNSPTQWRIDFSNSGAVLTNVIRGRIQFQAHANSSAIVKLEPFLDRIGKQDGTEVESRLSHSGRVIVIDDAGTGLLETLPMVSGNPELIIYGTAGVAYEVQASTKLSPPNWTSVWNGLMPETMLTNVHAFHTNSPPASPALFFRSKR
jgi:hypothetical protein